jgi:hypothetical protein
VNSSAAWQSIPHPCAKTDPVRPPYHVRDQRPSPGLCPLTTRGSEQDASRETRRPTRVARAGRRDRNGTAFAISASVPSLTLSRAAVALHGVSPSDLGPAELTREAAHMLKPLLESYGFDLTAPIRVVTLPDSQGFHLTQ